MTDHIVYKTFGSQCFSIDHTGNNLNYHLSQMRPQKDRGNANRYLSVLIRPRGYPHRIADSFHLNIFF